MAKKIGIYTIQERIGGGNYGVVHKGLNTKTNEPIAAKVIPTEKLNGKLLQQVECEIKALKQLTSPHIVALHDVLKTKNNVYLITEFCAGGDLEQFLHSHERLSEELAQKWVRQLVEAFATLQTHQILHRDLKLANILLTEASEYGNVKVADFGFARFLTATSLAATQLGTPLFMAPEVCNAEHYNHKADVWSLGVLSYELLVGSPVFQCKSYPQLLKLQKEPVRFPSNIALSECAKHFVQSMLAYDYRDRPSFEDLLVHPFLSGVQAPGSAVEECEEDFGFIVLDSDDEAVELIVGEQDVPGRIMDLEFQVTQIEELLRYQLLTLDPHAQQAAACILYYAKNMLSAFSQTVCDMISESPVDQSTIYYLTALHSTIQLKCLNTTTHFNECAAEIGLATDLQLTTEDLAPLLCVLLRVIKGKLATDDSAANYQMTLLFLAVATHLGPDNEEAQELFQTTNKFMLSKVNDA